MAYRISYSRLQHRQRKARADPGAVDRATGSTRQPPGRRVVLGHPDPPAPDARSTRADRAAGVRSMPAVP